MGEETAPGLSYGRGMVVDASTGELYVADLGNNTVDEFSDEGTLMGEIRGPGGSFEPVAVAVEESTGDVYVVDRADDVVDQFNASGKYIGKISQTPEGPLIEPVGVAVNASGEVYVSHGGHPDVDVFGPSTVVPEVTTGPVSDRKRASVESRRRREPGRGRSQFV